MITLASIEACSGCAVCGAICPKNAIHMASDEEGFLRPVINKAVCVECGRCAAICPSLHPTESRQPMRVCAAKALESSVRMSSSSGGIFTLVAKRFIEKGGTVFGAVFDSDEWRVYLKKIIDVTGLKDAVGSKYVQSEMGASYQEVLAELATGRKVMFVGSPCQVAALRCYLDALGLKDRENLLLVDFICHGVPSPKAWHKYLIERKNGVNGARKIIGISFRNKKFGWKQYSMHIRFDDGTEYLQDLKHDPFLMGFIADLYLRKSCHSCGFKALRSGSDITLGDYWRVHESFPAMDDGCGTSLVVLNTSRGVDAFGDISQYVDCAQSTYKDAVRVNPCIISSPTANKNRKRFFSKIEKEGFDRLVRECLKIGLMQRFLLLAQRGWCFIRRKVAG